MVTMQRFLLLLGLCCLCASGLQAQYLSLRSSGCPAFAHNQGSEYFYGGFGLTAQYDYALSAGRLLGAMEYRAIQWGSQLTLNLGYDHPFVDEGPWRASVRVQAQAGSALFTTKGLFVWGAEVGATLQWQSPKAFFAVLGVGLRYTNCPAYSDYSRISAVWEVPLTVGIGFRLGNRKR